MKKKKTTKAGGTQSTAEPKKVRKKPVRSWLKKMLDKLKANRAKRKLSKAREEDSVRTREPNTDRIDNPKENILDKLSDTANAVIKKEGDKAIAGLGNVDEDAKQEKAEEENAKNKKYWIIGVIAVIIILVIIYFVTKKK